MYKRSSSIVHRLRSFTQSVLDSVQLGYYCYSSFYPTGLRQDFVYIVRATNRRQSKVSNKEDEHPPSRPHPPKNRNRAACCLSLPPRCSESLQTSPLGICGSIFSSISPLSFASPHTRIRHNGSVHRADQCKQLSASKPDLNPRPVSFLPPSLTRHPPPLPFFGSLLATLPSRGHQSSFQKAPRTVPGAP